MVALDKTGVLDIDGAKVFPIGVSNPPPIGGKTTDGKDAYAELAAAGVNFMRIGMQDWNLAGLDQQLAATKQFLDAGQAHGIRSWLWLGETPFLPGHPDNQALLQKIVPALKDHPGLGAWKGIDEPHNPKGGQWRPVDPKAMTAAYKLVGQLDPGHPLVVTHEPLSKLPDLKPYAAACDITGADIYPVSYPPGDHAALANTDISLVGDLTKKMVQVAQGRPVWMTLQIAWSGIAARVGEPDLVPRFPTLLEERFMVYQAIVNGARGLMFFGGNMTQVMRPIDAKTGWNWTFWQQVLRPVLSELTSTAVGPALVAPASNANVKASANDVELTTRQAGGLFYVIAVRRGPATNRVTFSGLPSRHDGTALGSAQVLFEYAQEPPPPPLLPNNQQFRSVSASGGSFQDWLGPHDARVYRFQL